VPEQSIYGKMKPTNVQEGSGMSDQPMELEIAIPVRHVGKKKGIPKTCLPPLGEEWDRKMELVYELSKSGKNMQFYIGCFKTSSTNGVNRYG
jgi:hypothetical protein